MLFLGFSFLVSLNAGASIQVLNETKQSFVNNEFICQFNETCDLFNFSLVELKKKVVLPNTPDSEAYFLTDIRAVYQTESVDKIEKYSIVQMIKGCMYESTWDGVKLEKNLTFNRDHMGKSALFKHKTWQVDNDHEAPIYTGVKFDSGKINPFYLLRWNMNPKSLVADNAKFYGREIPPHPIVFAVDMPGPASFRTETYQPGKVAATNVSFEFKTCLFKTEDLPAATDADGANIDFTNSIQCFNWNHKYIYDFVAEKFNSPNKIEDICLN